MVERTNDKNKNENPYFSFNFNSSQKPLIELAIPQKLMF